MKKTFYLSCSLLLLLSCKSSEDIADVSDQDQSEVAIEMIAEYCMEINDRYIDSVKDSDFIDVEVSAAMTKSRMYSGVQTRSSSGEITDECDTLFTSEQIPLCAEVYERTAIYQNCTSEYAQETVLDPESNPILGFYEEPLDLSMSVARIEIKDGKCINYNSDGVVLSETEIEIPDYSETLAELAEYQKAMDTKSSVKRDINWLRARMSEISSVKSGSSESYAIYENERGNIILEQNFAATKGSGGMTVRTELSPDISKRLGYEQYIGGKLKVRSTNTYSSSNPQTRSIGTPEGISEENPEKTVTEMLVYTNDGTPMIKVESKTYRTNRTVYNIK